MIEQRRDKRGGFALQQAGQHAGAEGVARANRVGYLHFEGRRFPYIRAAQGKHSAAAPCDCHQRGADRQQACCRQCNTGHPSHTPPRVSGGPRRMLGSDLASQALWKRRRSSARSSAC